ncbi:MAG TPA: hypothetical protein VJC11_03210 [Patescibacteria group bacterium]|nr:hypothetical protein [Patescibacteria group bacterium]
MKLSSSAVLKSLSGAVKNAPSGGARVPQKLQKFLKSTRLPDPHFGSVTVKKLLEKPIVQRKQVEKIFAQGDEKGLFRDSASVKNIYQKAVQIENKQAVEQAKIQKAADFEQLKVEKGVNISTARKEGSRWERQRIAAFGGQEEMRGGQVVQQEAVQERFRKDKENEKYQKQGQVSSGLQREQEKKYEINLRVSGHEKGNESSQDKINNLLHRVMSEEGTGSRGRQSSGSSGGAVSSVKIEGSAAIDQLTHPQNAGSESYVSGPMQVKGIPSSQPDGSSLTSPRGQTSRASVKDITDLDIG